MVIKEKEFKPVIIGGDINAYCIARAFHEEYQIKSLVVSQVYWGPSINSKIIDNIKEEKLENDKIFVKRLIEIAKANKSKKLILFACGDWYVKQLLRNKDKLIKYYIIPYIDLGLMDKLVMKDSFYNICEQLDIDYPKTFVYDCKQKNELDFDFNYPVAAKPADGVLYHYAKFPGKKKGFKFYNEAELKAMLNNLHESSYDGKFIIQDFIPGDDSNMHVLTCYCDKNSKVRLYALGHVLLEEHTPGAIGNHAAIINEVNEEIFAQAQKFLEHVGFVGFANFDIKYDARDGKYKFFEINIRLGRSNYYITGSGFNVAKLIVDEYIYGKEIKDTIANNENLYLIIPKMLLFKYLKDKDARKKAKQLIKAGKVCYPLIYKGDNKLKRLFYVRANLIRQIQKYRKYYEIPIPKIDNFNKEQMVGVIGGIGPLSTTYFMNMVINITEANKDQEHINMIVFNHATIPDRTAYLLNSSNNNPAILMAEDAQKLEKMGVTFIVIPCNTAHYFYQYIQDRVSIPIINIIEETIKYIMANNPPINKIGLLATDGTILTNSYQKEAANHNIECVLPNEKTQKQLMHIIYNEVKAGKAVDVDLLQKIIEDLEKEGCQKIILGCTELSVINKDFVLKNEKLVDSLEVLASKTVLLSDKKIRRR